MGKKLKNSNPWYVYLDDRRRLGEKSLKAFGAKNKYMKLANRLNISIESIEEQMDAIIEAKNNGGNDERQRIQLNRKRRRHLRKLTRANEQRNNSKEVRSGETKNGTDTIDSTDGSGESIDVRGE